MFAYSVACATARPALAHPRCDSASTPASNPFKYSLPILLRACTLRALPCLSIPSRDTLNICFHDPSDRPSRQLLSITPSSSFLPRSPCTLYLAPPLLQVSSRSPHLSRLASPPSTTVQPTPLPPCNVCQLLQTPHPRRALCATITTLPSHPARFHHHTPSPPPAINPPSEQVRTFFFSSHRAYLQRTPRSAAFVDSRDSSQTPDARASSFSSSSLTSPFSREYVHAGSSSVSIHSSPFSRPTFNLSTEPF